MYRHIVWTMDYKIPDGWPLPKSITWVTCDICGMLYGDGPFDQETLNRYYRDYYGYGVNSVDVNDRLKGIADWMWRKYGPETRFVDFGGSGDDGKSIACERLKELGWKNVTNVNAGDKVPECDILLASHVLEHIYDMDDAMAAIDRALAPKGLLIVDGPDATGISLEWGMPMLDFHTKHINHFRMIDYLTMMIRYKFEMIWNTQYTDIRSAQKAHCVRIHFRRFSTALHSRDHVQANVEERLEKLNLIDYPVNVWGLGDISWHLLAWAHLDVLEYIDNDPAYRGQTYDGKAVLERPTNDAPIVIMAQGQREKLIANIRKMGIESEIVEI